ncbi:MAG: hypothetical protein ACP5P1_15855 [Acidimicrobiales bacterium]
MAIEHSTLIAIWNMVIAVAFYNDPGGGPYTRLDFDKTKIRATNQLHTMGHA